MTAIPSSSLVIPTSTDPYQRITVNLGGQNCTINLYTKSIFIPKPSPVLPPPIPPIPVPPTVPPQYENANPVFVDLYVNSTTLIIGGVIALNNVPIVRNSYLGFLGDLAVIDTQGEEDPCGVPSRLPPQDLKNWWELNIGPANAEYAPSDIAGTIVGMGTRFQLTYAPV